MADNRSIQTGDPSLQTLPPQNVEAEEALLCAIFRDNSTLHDVLDMLTHEDFYRSSHQKIFYAITDMFSKGSPVDLVTMANYLMEKKQLEEIGGATYLARLVDTVPMAVNAPRYAEIIRDKASLRRLIEKSNAIVRRCFEDGGNVDEVIDFAERSMFEVSENKIKASFSHIGAIIDDNIDALEERQGNKALITGVASGYRKLDEMTAGFQGSDLVILAARPSMGKTALALNFARNAAVDAEVPVALFSLEMSKEQLSLRLLCSEARVDSSRVRTGFINNDDWNRITHAAGVLSNSPIFIDDSPDITSTSIRAKARRMKKEHDIGMIIIDYIQLMRGSSSMDRHLEISEISRSMKALAKEINVPVIALSQLNRKLEERTDKRPKLSDLRESGALEQDADVVAFIYRDEVYNREESNPNKGMAEVIISKQRNGPIGTAPLTFLGAYTRFEDLASDEYDGG